MSEADKKTEQAEAEAAGKKPEAKAPPAAKKAGTGTPGGKKAEAKGRPARKKTASRPEEKKSEATPKPGRGLSLLALVVSLAVAIGGYQLWQEVRTLRSGLANDVQDALSRLAESERQQREALQARLNEQRQADEARQAELRETVEQSLEALRAELGRDRDDWLLHEVEYLLIYANRRLHMARDPGSALAALQAADERLKAQADPRLLPIREAVTAERQSLEAIAQIDLDGMMLELGSLAERVDTLPIPGIKREALAEVPAAPSADEPVAWGDWQGLLDAMWEDVKGLVKVRRGEQLTLPLTAPEQRFFLRENLRLKLLTARMALLQGQPSAYRANLEEAQNWLGRYFDAETTAVQAAIASLERLKQIEIRPELPDISTSLKRLRELRKGDGAAS